MGEVSVLTKDGRFVPGRMAQQWVTCPECGGQRGWYVITTPGTAPRYRACHECGGVGRVQRARMVPDDE